MADQQVHSCESDKGANGDDVATRTVEAVVVALLPAFGQVRVEAVDGCHYALTRRTQGIDLGSLIEGQRLTCQVAARLSIVLSADAISD